MVGVAIELEVVPGVVEPDLMEFQEPIEVIAGGKGEEAAELRGGDFAFAEGFEGDGLEGGAGEVGGRAGEGRGELMGEVEGEEHGDSIGQRQEGGKRKVDEVVRT